MTKEKSEILKKKKNTVIGGKAVLRWKNKQTKNL